MKVFTLATLDAEPADPHTFVGQAWLTRMQDAATSPHMNVYRVKFAPGARTNWHSHTGPQLLQIIEGVCRYQNDGEPIREARVGDLLVIEPDERHWHGAAPDSSMTHVAINLAAKTSWFEAVTDAQYAPA
jgi:quercetin dioxygenase-like cupin family protein